MQMFVLLKAVAKGPRLPTSNGLLWGGTGQERPPVAGGAALLHRVLKREAGSATKRPFAEGSMDGGDRRGDWLPLPGLSATRKLVGPTEFEPLILVPSQNGLSDRHFLVEDGKGVDFWSRVA